MKSARCILILILGCRLIAVGPSFAVLPQEGTRGDSATGGEQSTAESTRPELAPLELLVGPWRFIETHFDPAGREMTTAEGTEEIGWILDRQALRRTYTRRGEGGVFSAVGHIAWSTVKKQYVGLWLNNDPQTGPVFLSGEWQSDSSAMVLTLDAHRRDGTVQQFRVVERFLDPEEREATTYELKEGRVIKRLVVRYKRAVPCPDRLRIIFDDALGGRPTP